MVKSRSYRKKQGKMLKVEVDCAHNSPHVTIRPGENDTFIYIFFALNLAFHTLSQ